MSKEQKRRIGVAVIAVIVGMFFSQAIVNPWRWVTVLTAMLLFLLILIFGPDKPSPQDLKKQTARQKEELLQEIKHHKGLD